MIELKCLAYSINIFPQNLKFPLPPHDFSPDICKLAFRASKNLNSGDCIAVCLYLEQSLAFTVNSKSPILGQVELIYLN